MTLTVEQVNKALSFVIDPDLKKDIIELGLVSNLERSENKVKFTLAVSNPAMHNKKRMQEACEHHITRFHKGVEVEVVIVPLGDAKERKPEHRTILPGVKQIIAVSSGKGGVGKSTITANLAAGMAMKGYKVGLVDADIYGPSIPMMFDVISDKPQVKDIDGKQVMVPVESHGVKILSIGFFADINQAVIWRGPMAAKALTQMFRDVHWGDLDVMFIDLPPGTGDIHLTLVQSIPMTGALVVSTPQPVALADARKGIHMFNNPNLKIPVLGLIENMSWFTPDELPDNKYYIFGKDGVQGLSEELNIPVIGHVPLIQSIREAGDAGRPAILQKTTVQAKAMMSLVNEIESNIFSKKTQELNPA